MAAAPLKILLVDDEAHVRKFLRIILRSALGDTEVAEAGNREEAMREFAARLPGLVLLDINLVGESGLEILRDIRALDETVPVVMLTSVNVRHTVEEAIAAGASGYILKDSPPEEMAAVLREALDQAQADSAPESTP
jgi:DNA-binding NarL/FixJ family response regulator